MTRSISYSEVTSAMTCEAQHAFGYTGYLTRGRTLQPKGTAAILREGRAWGAAVAAWHSTSSYLLSPANAHAALIQSLREDAAEMAEQGIEPDPAELEAMIEYLSSMLDHYMATTQALPNLTRLEDELDVPLPSRGRGRSSSRYRFLGRLDGFTEAGQGSGQWLVEFKLRRALTPLKIAQKQRQYRWYAWSRQRESGIPVVGLLLDERLNAIPKPARIVQGSKKGTFTVSHAVDQMTTPMLYLAACEEHKVAPNPDTVIALGQRVWQVRHPIVFAPSELEEAGRELVSAAKLIRDLDSGERYPIRNAGPRTCGGCRYKDICDSPHDDLFIEQNFSWTEPKRLRSVKVPG